MKHWKPRAAAIVILTAALLTGAFTALNSDGEAPAAALLKGDGGIATTLNRWVAALTGGLPAGEEAPADGTQDGAQGDTQGDAQDGTQPGGTLPDGSTPAPGTTAAPGVVVADDGTVLQDNQDDPPGTRPVQIRIGSGHGVAPVETPLANVAPNQRIPRDYHVDNRGTQDAYVFLTVTLPYVAIATQKSDGAYVPISSQPLYTFQANAGWTLLENSINAGRITYVYAYATGLGAGSMTALAPGGSTPALFDVLVTANYVEGKLDGTQEEVVTRAYAIQTRELGEATTPEAIWRLIQNSAH